MLHGSHKSAGQPAARIPARMSEPSVPQHSAEFHRLCDEAVERLRALLPADAHGRGALIPAIRALLERIDAQVEELDILAPGFAAEQGALGDAASALQSIDMDRGGPHVPRCVERAIADIRRLAGG
jgi:hypothetical protein